MNAQRSIPFPAQYMGKQQWEVLLELVRLSVNHLGLKEVAFAIDVSGSQLSDSLNERERKGVRAEWLCVIKHMLNNKGDSVAADLRERIRDAEGVDAPLDHELSEEEIAVLNEMRKRKRRKR